MATEKRLIDANALKKEAWPERYTGEGIIYVEDVDKAPTVDAVEVVRCKDCRWARPQDHRDPVDTPNGSLICECFMHHHIPALWGARLAVNPDDFCSKGERRNDG